jgi:hypothetical protein
MNCKDHSSVEKGIFNLIHFEKDHKDNFKRQQPEANLTIVEQDVTLVSPIATKLEPKEEMDANELVFTPGAWYCPLANVPAGVTTVNHIPQSEPLAETEYPPYVPILVKDALGDDELVGMPVLLTHHDDDSSNDEADIKHFYENISGSDIIPPAQEFMTIYL